MVAPSNAMTAVARTIADSGELPSDMGLMLHEADPESEDADVEMPALEIELVESSRVHPNNTDLVGWTVDENGNRTGRIYRAEYELTLEIDVWTSTGDGYDANELGKAVRRALYPHSSYGDGEPFSDENGKQIDEIFRFVVSDGARADDLIQTPTVRRWRQEVELWAYEEFQTTEDYIVDVNYPASGDFNDDDNDGTIDDT